MNAMDDKQKQDQYKLFADAFHEVVVPLLENMTTKDDIKNMATKDDIKEIRDEMATKDDIYRLEVKIDKMTDRIDRQGKTLDDHEIKIESIQTHLGIAV